MRSFITLLFLLIIFPLALNAQKRCAILSTEAFTGNRSAGIMPPVIRTADGGYILQLWSECSSGNFPAGICLTDTIQGETRLIKYDADGTMRAWLHCFDNLASNISNLTFGIYPLGDGDFMMAGDGNISTLNGPMITKWAPDGTLIWKKVYGSTYSSTITRAACRMTDSGCVLASETYGHGDDVGPHYGSQFTSDVFVVRVDSSGNKVWARTFGGSYDDKVRAVVPAPDDGVYVIGFTRSNDYDFSGLHIAANDGADGYVVRLDSAGNVLWKQCYGGSAWDVLLTACSDGKGGIFTAGFTESSDGTVVGYKGHNDLLWINDIDSNGSITWTNCYGSPAPGADNEPKAVCAKGDDGTFWIASTSILQGDEVDTAYGKGDTWVLHVSNNGDFINSRVLGSPNGGCGPTMITPTTSGVMVGGYYHAAGGTMPSVCFSAPYDYSGYLIHLSSSSVGVPETARPAAPGLSAYPNPAKDAIYVSVQDAAQASGQVWLTNISGQPVTQKTATHGAQKITISCAHLPPGAYIVQYENSQGSRRQQKIIIE